MVPVCSTVVPAVPYSTHSTVVPMGTTIVPVGTTVLEDVDQFFDQSIIKDQIELAERMAEVTRATSEWHRRMTAENLSQSGYVVDLTK